MKGLTVKEEELMEMCIRDSYNTYTSTDVNSRVLRYKFTQ